MKYLLDTGLPTNTQTWLCNFIDKCQQESKRSKTTLSHIFMEKLKEHHGYGTSSAFIEFDNEEDAVAFVLRYM